MIHITRKRKILCHLQNGGMVFTVNFNEASGMHADNFCPDCRLRHQNICKMLGIRPIGESTVSIVEKRILVDQLRSHTNRIKNM